MASPAANASAPGQQVSVALLSLARTPDGTQRMTLHLSPPELGLVQIRIDRPQDAPARVDIAVERPDTMTLLLRDQQQLQRTLDLAGVPPDGRSLTLHVAAPDRVTPSGGTDGGAGTANAGMGQSGYHSGTSNRPAGQAAPDGASDGVPEDGTESLVRWMRAGLDITA
jgi:flagellar hook-length control protein FliK